MFNTGNKDEDIINLLNMAIDIVEIWDTKESPYNQKLKEAWIKRAIEIGAIKRF